MIYPNSQVSPACRAAKASLHPQTVQAQTDDETRLYIGCTTPRANVLCGIEKPSCLRDAPVPKVQALLRTLRAGIRCAIQRTKRPVHPNGSMFNGTWR